MRRRDVHGGSELGLERTRLKVSRAAVVEGDDRRTCMRSFMRSRSRVERERRRRRRIDKVRRGL